MLSLITLKEQIPAAIKVYEEVRKDRGEKIQASAATTRQALHLPDGKEQQQRDEKIRAAGRGEGQNPDLWADSSWQDFMWGTDVMKDTVTKWDELLSRAEGHHIHDLRAMAYT